MAVVARGLIFLVFVISIVQSRVLRLNSSEDHLISDGVENQEWTVKTNTNSGPSIPNSCDHQYGFLPCAENAAGYISQIVVYQGLLMFGEKQIGWGSEVLFNIIGADQKFGGIIFRILMALPSMMLMIASGIFSSKENAQSLVSVGVGVYAGITVFSLTIQWGICVIFGRRDLEEKPDEHGETSHSNCFPAKEKLIILKDSGVGIDAQTQCTAGIMLLSLIPYVVVQLVDVFSTSSGKRIINLIALIGSSLSLLSYFIYQILDPRMQQRSLEYSKYEILRTGFLQHMERQGLMNENGELDTQAIKTLFAEADKDANKRIEEEELKKLVREIFKTGKMNVIDEDSTVKGVMNEFDSNRDSFITLEEFIKGSEQWFTDEAKLQSSLNSDSASTSYVDKLVGLFKEKKEDNSQEIDRIMSKILKHAETQLLKSEKLITPDGKPNIERIQILFKQFDTDEDNSISSSELQQLIRTVKFGAFQQNEEDVLKELFKYFDKDNNNIVDEREFVEGVKTWLNKAIRVAKTPDRTKSISEYEKIVWKEAVYDKWALIKSVFQVLIGIVLLTFLGGPLMVSILQLSYAMGLPSFSISFVIVPLAMNARVAITALLPASQKNERSASLTFSEIYGGVIMNNIAGLTALLAIVHAKDLTWDFSAEVLTIFIVCAIIGILAYSSKTYPLWTCMLAFVLYLFSLGLLYFVQICGGVVTNNIMGLSTLLAIVYAKDLKWDYSADFVGLFSNWDSGILTNHISTLDLLLGLLPFLILLSNVLCSSVCVLRLRLIHVLV